MLPRLQSEATGGAFGGFEDMGPLEEGPNRNSSDLCPFIFSLSLLLSAATNVSFIDVTKSWDQYHKTFRAVTVGA